MPLVGIVLQVGDQFEITGTPSYKAEMYAIGVGELVPQSGTEQENLVDVHRITMACSDSFHLTAIRGGSDRLSLRLVCREAWSA
jgi:hypothetical protein